MPVLSVKPATESLGVLLPTKKNLSRIFPFFFCFFLFSPRKTICYVCAGNISCIQDTTSDCDHVTHGWANFLTAA